MLSPELPEADLQEDGCPMNEELRAMTLSLAVTLVAGVGADPDDVIEIAKKFQRHIEYGTGIA
jgi:hypothetical protein